MLTKLLLRVFVKNYHRPDAPGVRTRLGFLEAWISIAGNLILFFFKIVFAIAVNSVSLMADAFHTLSDMATSIIILFGFRTAGRPSDSKHPYGHGRAENIAALIVAILLIITGIEFIHAAIRRLNNPQPITNTTWIIIIMVISIIIKEWLARFSFHIARIIKSKMLEADAWHHRADSFTSILVILAAVGAKCGFPFLDGVFALIIALLIIWTGFRLARSTASFLLGEAPSPELVNQIITIAASVPGVKGIHGIEIHDYGTTKTCSAHIEVTPNLSTDQSHEIANEVEGALKTRLGLPTVVHIDINPH